MASRSSASSATALRTRLVGALPIDAAELREGGRRAAAVSADAADLVGRQEDLVVAREVELELLRRAAVALGHAGVARSHGRCGPPHRRPPARSGRGSSTASRGSAAGRGSPEELAVGEELQARRLVGEPTGEPWTRPMAPAGGGCWSSATGKTARPSSSSSPTRLAWSVVTTSRSAASSASHGPMRSARPAATGAVA